MCGEGNWDAPRKTNRHAKGSVHCNSVTECGGRSGESEKTKGRRDGCVLVAVGECLPRNGRQLMTCLDTGRDVPESPAMNQCRGK